MVKSPFIFIANWKMQKTFNDSLKFITDHRQELSELSSKTNSLLILCPSFLALPYFSTTLKNSALLFGAQNCSAYDKGPYTGQIDAASLAQLSCHYCIVGHSEQRHYFHETNYGIAQKVTQLVSHNITPIVCIGETKEEYTYKKTLRTLYEQLMPVLETKNINKICIAYEPVWAIGTGKNATRECIEDIVQLLAEWIKPYNFFKNSTLMYGGSVDENNIESIATIEQLGGVLIGSASLDFKKLKNIVSLHKKIK